MVDEEVSGVTAASGHTKGYNSEHEHEWTQRRMTNGEPWWSCSCGEATEQPPAGRKVTRDTWACVCGWRPSADPIYEGGRCEDAHRVHVRSCAQAEASSAQPVAQPKDPR